MSSPFFLNPYHFLIRVFCFITFLLVLKK